MATKNFAQADQNSLLVWLQSHVANVLERPPRGHVFPFQSRYELTTDELDNADDKSQLLWCPTGIWCLGGSIWFESDADTSGTPALVWDLISETSGDVADGRKLIAGSTKGRAAGDVAVIDNGVGAYVGERYITMDITTAAATAGATDILLTLWLARGMGTNSLPSLTLDAL